MATAGYSGTPLIRKLGIKDSFRVLLLHAPEQYFEWLETDISDQLVNKDGIPDFVHLFVADQQQFTREMKKLRPLYKRNPSMIIWVSWYKKSSGIQTDMTEDVIRHFALQNDLVDVKVCAVNEAWSGLKLVVPVAKRK